jgi:hypothetical protein
LTLTDPGPIPHDNVYTYTARRVDQNRNPLPGAASLAVTFLLQPPALFPASSIGDDSGLPGDGITNVPQPHLFGVTDASATVELLTADGTVLNTITADPVDGSYLIAPAHPLADGTYALEVRVTNIAGSFQTSPPITVTIKTKPPATPSISLAAADDSGAKGDGITNVVLPHFVGTTDPFVVISLENDANEVVGGAFSERDGTYTLEPTKPLADGTYRLHAVATDAAGNTSASTLTFSLTIVTRIPDVPALYLAPADDTGIKGDNVTAVRRPVLTGTTTPGAVVELFDSNQSLIGESGPVPASGFFGIRPTADLPPGVSYLSTRVTDVAGNVGPYGFAMNLTIPAVAGDLDWDAKAGFATFRPGSPATWTTSQPHIARYTTSFGTTGDIPVLGDFYGEGLTDIGVFRPSNSTWYLDRPQLPPDAIQFGATGDIPVAGDFDGDAKTDLAVYRPSNATWYIRRSSLGPEAIQFGAPNLDIPVVADFDGDGKADIAVYRPTTGEWFIDESTGVRIYQPFVDHPGDIPDPADYTGDGKADIAVFQPATATWIIMPSEGGGTIVRQFGAPNLDIPVPLDYDGDGRTDLAVYRPTTSTFFSLESSAGPHAQVVGQPGDIPAAAPLILVRSVDQTTNPPGGTSGGSPAPSLGNSSRPPSTGSSSSTGGRSSHKHTGRRLHHQRAGHPIVSGQAKSERVPASNVRSESQPNDIILATALDHIRPFKHIRLGSGSARS